MNPVFAHAVVLNPHSGGGKSVQRWNLFLKTEPAKRVGLDAAILFDGRHLKSSRLLAGLTDWILKRLDAGCQNFVAAGGDGTVNLVVNALMSLKDRHPSAKTCRVGAVGLGRTNDFHRPLSSDQYQLETEVYYRLNFASAFPHDVGQVETPFVHYFVINSSVGVTAQAHLFYKQAGPWFKALKRISCNLAVAIATAREFYQFQSFPVRITQSGNSVRAVELVNLGVVKNPHFAGSFQYDSYQKPDDGKLGIFICESIGKIQMLKMIASLSRGKFSGLPGTATFEAKDLRIDSSTPFALETDGEVRQARTARFKILPQELYLCPKGG
jgi:diacylglycerol kinase family enzyme